MKRAFHEHPRRRRKVSRGCRQASSGSRPACLFHTLLIIVSLLTIGALSACSPSPDTFEEQLSHAEAKLGQGRVDAALADYRSLAKRYRGKPQEATILLHIADLLADVKGDLAGGVKAYGDVIARAPLGEVVKEALLKRAQHRETLEDYEGAIADMTSVITRFPQDPKRDLYRVQLAAEYLSLRDYRQARLELKPLIEGKETKPEVLERALFVAAESFFLEGDTRKAAGYYRWLLHAFPESELAAESKLHLATCYEEMGYLGVAQKLTEGAKNYPNKAVVESRLESLDNRGTITAESTSQPSGTSPDAR